MAAPTRRTHAKPHTCAFLSLPPGLSFSCSCCSSLRVVSDTHTPTYHPPRPFTSSEHLGWKRWLTWRGPPRASFPRGLTLGQHAFLSHSAHLSIHLPHQEKKARDAHISTTGAFSTSLCSAPLTYLLLWAPSVIPARLPAFPLSAGLLAQAVQRDQGTVGYHLVDASLLGCQTSDPAETRVVRVRLQFPRRSLGAMIHEAPLVSISHILPTGDPVHWPRIWGVPAS